MRPNSLDLRGDDDWHGRHEAATIDDGADPAKARNQAFDASLPAERLFDAGAWGVTSDSPIADLKRASAALMADCVRYKRAAAAVTEPVSATATSTGSRLRSRSLA